jgi:hypothetical protein
MKRPSIRSMAVAVAKLRTLNERQVREGVKRLRADLKVLRELGIIDELGNRVRRQFPAERSEEDSDDVV